MPTTRKPRAGSMQFWPRKRSRRQYARIRSWPEKKEPVMLGFAGYKAGMAHLLYTDNNKTSKTKGQDISCPVTMVECPPIRVSSVKLYKKDSYGRRTSKEINGPADKELSRKVRQPKQTKEKDLESINAEDYDDLTLQVNTQPKLTGTGKKKPELFEIGLGGSMKEKIEYAKNNLGKEIKITDVFKEGELMDIHAVTKGKGFQGPVKRFGIGLRPRKSEKARRGPGSLGGWKGQAHFMYRISHAGQTGYHQRTEYNKWLMRISSEQKDIEGIHPKGGFKKYGILRNPFILVKGSVAGPAKRLLRMSVAQRGSKRTPSEAPSIKRIVLE